MSVILTGDRPTGPLHLGHYVGSLKLRVELQNNSQNQLFILIANTQAYTDYFDNPTLVKENIFQILEDYIAVGLNPEKTCFFLQSKVKGLFELTSYFMNLVTISRLQRNPTIKEELKNKNFQNNILAGFLCYPISQAADILAFKADFVPVGIDQLPMIEQANEIAEKFNFHYKCNIFKKCQALLTETPKLYGIDGKQKASKSLKNTIFLNDSEEEIKRKVFSMFTDPNHLKIDDAGCVENNMVFHYLDAFFADKTILEQLKTDYRTPNVKLGDTYLKELLFKTLINELAPIKERRQSVNKKDLKEILEEGTKKANHVVNETLQELYEIFE